ncbi:DEAD/DEAH box helicase family protein [Intestinibacter sp.]
MPKKESGSEKGLRLPQFGAISTIQSHWTINDEAATIVMPTGTGKTEIMILGIIAEKIKRAVIVVPSNLLSQQTVKKIISFGVLKDIKLLKKQV